MAASDETSGRLSPIVWIHRLRDADDVTRIRMLVLFALAARMQRTGEGFASAGQLASDTGLAASTIRRHLTWGRRHGWIDQTARGHGGGTASAHPIASEWRLTTPDGPDQLITPEQLVTDPPLTTEQLVGGPTAQTTPTYRSDDADLPLAREHPREPLPENLSEGAEPSDRELQLVLAAVRTEGRIRDIDAWTGSPAGQRDIRARVERLRAEPNPMANIATEPLPATEPCRRCDQGLAIRTIGICESCQAAGARP